MYIDLKKEKFSSFINQLPSLLKNGWKVLDEKQIKKNPDCKESYLVCEYTESEIGSVLMCINLDVADTENHVTFELAILYDIDNQKILSSILRDFESMLQQQGCCIEICLDEDDDGNFITWSVDCDNCEKTIYSDEFLSWCPYCGEPFFTITRSTPSFSSEVLSLFNYNTTMERCFNSGLGEVQMIRLNSQEVFENAGIRTREPYSVIIDKDENVHFSTPITTNISSYNERFKYVCERISDERPIPPMSIYAEDGCMCVGAMITKQNFSKETFFAGFSQIEKAANTFRAYIAEYGY